MTDTYLTVALLAVVLFNFIFWLIYRNRHEGPGAVATGERDARAGREFQARRAAVRPGLDGGQLCRTAGDRNPRLVGRTLIVRAFD